MKKLILFGIVFLSFIHFALADNIILQSQDNETLGDSFVASNVPDNNNGGSTVLQVQHISSARQRPYFSFNTSTIPVGVIITNATLNLYMDYFENADSHNLYEVNKTASWDEESITWNNQPCGTNIGDTPSCNSTIANSVTPTGVGWYKFNVTPMIRRVYSLGSGNVSMVLDPVSGGSDKFSRYVSKEHATTSWRPYLNITYFVDDPGLPQITFYNMTSEGGEGCTNWNTDKNNACPTSDTTPTVFITTNEITECAIGISDLNYTNLGTNRTCSGVDALQHTCTLNAQDALTQEVSYLYIGCQDGLGNEDTKSTSGALKISLSSNDAETSGREAIEAGIREALNSGYILYTDQRIYARNSANNQSTGIFDKVVKWTNKIWAFNHLTENETAVGTFNITPVFYVLEIANSSFGVINSTVSQFILDTK